MEVQFPSEQFIENYIEKRITEDGCCPASGMEVDLHFRQLEIKGYGISDLVKVEYSEGHIDVTILELKNRQLKESDISQLARYMRGLERLLTKYQRRFRNFSFGISGELAGPLDVQSTDFVFIIGRLEDITVYGLELSLDHGFKSTEIGSDWFNHGEDWKSTRAAAREVFNLYPFMPATTPEMKELENGEG